VRRKREKKTMKGNKALGFFLGGLLVAIVALRAEKRSGKAGESRMDDGELTMPGRRLNKGIDHGH
jgi:hypothetical protein